MTNEKMGKVIRLALPFMILIWLPPILDFIISGFGSTPINNIVYILGDWDFVLRQYVTFFSDMGSFSATIGPKTEIILMLLGTSGYVWLKSGKWTLALLMVFIVYTVVFLYGTFPVQVYHPAEFRQAHGHQYFLPIGRARSSLFLFILFFQVLLWMKLDFPDKFKTILSNLRPLRVAHYLGMLGLGFYLGFLKFGSAWKSYDWTLWGSAALLLIAVIFIWLSSVFLNDIVDMEGDRLSNPDRPLLNGKINVRESYILGLVFFIIALICAGTLNWASLHIVLFCGSISIAYSFPPLRLKRFPVISTFLIASASLALVALGFMLFSKADLRLTHQVGNHLLTGFPRPIAAMLLICFTLSFNTKDLKDIKGDRATGTWTLPVLFGETWGKRSIGLLVLLSYAMVPWILDLKQLFWASLLAGFLNIWFITRPKTNETLVFIVYYSYMSIVAFYVLQNPMVLF